jgi:hypothetical protein
MEIYQVEVVVTKASGIEQPLLASQRLLSLRQNQSKCVLLNSFQGRRSLMHHPNDKDLSLGTPGSRRLPAPASRLSNSGFALEPPCD